MKNIIIWGTRKSGKSTLAQIIKQKYGHAWTATDHLRDFYDGLLPGNKIHDKSDFEQGHMMSNAMGRYIGHLCWLAKTGNQYFVCEGVSLDLDSLLKFNNVSENCLVICMGYPDISPQEKLTDLRKHEAENDWTRKLSDTEMLEDIKKAIRESQIVRETAKRLGLKFIDCANLERASQEAMKFIDENI